MGGLGREPFPACLRDLDVRLDATSQRTCTSDNSHQHTVQMILERTVGDAFSMACVAGVSRFRPGEVTIVQIICSQKASYPI